jgi:hypothetical protein
MEVGKLLKNIEYNRTGECICIYLIINITIGGE